MVAGKRVKKMSKASRPGRTAVEADQDGRLPLGGCLVGERRERGDVDALVSEEGGVAYRYLMRSDAPTCATSRKGHELRERRQLRPFGRRMAGNSLGQRMFGAPLDRRRLGQHRARVDARQGAQVHHAGLTQRERPGLVEDDRVDRGQPLQWLPALNQYP